MHSFTDTKGRTWSLSITVGTVKRIRAETDCDPLDLGDSENGLSAVLGDLLRFADLLYVVCKPQAEERGIDEADFAEGIAGDCILEAREAYVAALAEFFPEKKRRALLQGILRKGRELETMLLERGLKDLETVDLDSLAESAIGSASSSPASSASSRNRGPSGSSSG